MSVVVIVLPKMEDAKKIRKILMGHGFPQVFAYATASAALSEIREHESGMVISGYHLKDMYYTELADSLPPNFELCLLYTSVQERFRSRWRRVQNPVKVDIFRRKKYIRGSQRPDIPHRV